MAIAAVEAEARYCDGVGFSAAGDAVQFYAQATWTQARGIAYDLLKTVDGVVRYLSTQPGRRILVFASGGFISEELGTLKDGMIRRAIAARVTINALGARGLYTDDFGRSLADQGSSIGVLPEATYIFEASARPAQRQAEESAMAELAEATGGLFFHNNNDLTLGFERLGLAPDVVYQVGFAPANLKHDGQFHSLRFALTPEAARRHPHAIVQARRGYFAPAAASPAEGLETSLEAVMRGTARETALPATLRVQLGPGGLGFEVRLDANRLNFDKQKGRRDDQIVILGALFRADDTVADGQRGRMDLDLGDKTWKRFREQGLGAKLALHARPGRYRLRVAVGEASSGRVSSIEREVVIQP